MSIKNISLDVDYVKAQFPAFSDPLSSKWSFFENAGEEVAKSGHILESTEVTNVN